MWRTGKMIEKRKPSQTIIDILTEEIRTFGLPFAKDKKSFGATKESFDRIKNMQGSETLNLKASMTWGTYDMQRKKEPFIKKVIKELDASCCTNTLFYSQGSFIDWHTNSDDPGIRTYILYTSKPGIFRYKDQTTGEIVDDLDFVGWTQRSFKVDKENLLWHCVYSPAPRFAYGFNRV